MQWRQPQKLRHAAIKDTGQVSGVCYAETTSRCYFQASGADAYGLYLGRKVAEAESSVEAHSNCVQIRLESA